MYELTIFLFLIICKYDKKPSATTAKDTVLDS